MPQMSPMNWMMIFNYMLLILMMIIMMMYFMYIPKNNNYIYKFKKKFFWNFKW